MAQSDEVTRDRCFVCDGDRLETLLFHEGRVLSSDRRVVDGVLAKDRCADCGAIRTRSGTGISDAKSFYADEYEQNQEMHKFSYITADGVVPRSLLEWEAVRHLRAPKPGERWLEVGCGAGDVLSHLAEEAPETAVFGLELSSVAARLAGSRGLSVAQASYDAVQGKFDVIMAIGVIEHLDDPGQFVRDLTGMLATGGTVILALPDVETDTFDGWFVDHLHQFSAAHIQRLCRAAGLTGFCDGWRPAETPHFMYLAADNATVTSELPLPTAVPAAVAVWSRGLDRVRECLQKNPRVGFLGASETAAFLLAYTTNADSTMPILFDDMLEEPTERYGCRVLPGSALDEDPAIVDVVVIATVPAYYERIRKNRIASMKAPVVFPLD